MATIIIWAIAIIIILAVIIAALAWFYQRGTREISLVKTGVGGRKIIMDGGTGTTPSWATRNPTQDTSAPGVRDE